jgi:Type IV secretion system pilin
MKEKKLVKAVATITTIAAVTFFTSSIGQPAYAQTVDPGGFGGVTGLHLPELAGIFVSIIKDLFALIGVVTVIIIVVGGLRMIVSGGDPKAMASARASVTYGIIGLVVALLAVTIVTVAGNFLNIPNVNFIRLP